MLAGRTRWLGLGLGLARVRVEGRLRVMPTLQFLVERELVRGRRIELNDALQPRPG